MVLRWLGLWGGVWLSACGGRWAPPPLAELTPESLQAAQQARYRGDPVVARARVLAVGDLLMHTNVKNSAASANRVDEAGQSTNHGGYEALFEHVQGMVSGVDVAFANLETPIAPKADRGTRSMVFNAPVDLLGAARAVGFDVLSFANNHVWDQGTMGFSETLEHLDASGLVWAGAGRSCEEARAPRFTEHDGLKVAWIAASTVYNADLNTTDDALCAFRLDLDQAAGSAAKARADGADFVLVSVHWGREYRPAPDEAEVAAGRALVDAGADVVLGHHPHVVQPIEVHEAADGRLGVIAYSLGNFISNQAWWYRHGLDAASRGAPRDGIALRFDLITRRDRRGRTRAEVADVVAIPLWTDSDARALAEPSPTIRVVPIDDALRQTWARMEGATAEELPALEARARLLVDRRNQIEAHLGTSRWLPLWPW